MSSLPKQGHYHDGHAQHLVFKEACYLESKTGSAHGRAIQGKKYRIQKQQAFCDAQAKPKHTPRNSFHREKCLVATLETAQSFKKVERQASQTNQTCKPKPKNTGKSVDALIRQIELKKARLEGELETLCRELKPKRPSLNQRLGMLQKAKMSLAKELLMLRGEI